MTAIERARLIKLLNMTASANDAEALSAVRRSNDLLRAAASAWEDLIVVPNDVRSVLETPRPAPQRQDTEQPVYHPSESQLAKGSLAKVSARARIRSIPVTVRLVLFPAWATAEAYVTACMGEQWPMKGVALMAPLAVGAIAAGLWFALIASLLNLL